MMTLQLPDINGATPTQQLGQIKTYLYQLARYLQVEQDNAGSNRTTELRKNHPVTTSADSTISPEMWNATKSLIIKSAQIADAFYEKISIQLDGKYVAASEYGDYTEQTALELEATSKALTQLYTNIQTLDTKTQQLIESTAYLRSGLLDYSDDGAPVYGLEIGQKIHDQHGNTTFDKYARFTAGKLSFYDNSGNEVAYVSDRKLYITCVQITHEFAMGRFVDTVRALDGSIVSRWV